MYRLKRSVLTGDCGVCILWWCGQRCQVLEKHDKQSPNKIKRYLGVRVTDDQNCGNMETDKSNR